MNYLFAPQPIISIPIFGSGQTFPVRRIYCVGRNYAEHAMEMGHSKLKAPFFFSKPTDALVINPETIDYPAMTSELHHEVELVIAIEKSGFEVDMEQAEQMIYGYALGIDLTKRDLQNDYKKQARPWDLAKGFDQSAPISSIIPKSQVNNIEETQLQLMVNGNLKQQGQIKQMIWSIAEIIVALSKHIELKAGDLIFSGTPSGVSEIKKGQTVKATLNTIQLDLNLNFTVK